jgi:hypothetical protein
MEYDISLVHLLAGLTQLINLRDILILLKNPVDLRHGHILILLPVLPPLALLLPESVQTFCQEGEGDSPGIGFGDEGVACQLIFCEESVHEVLFVLDAVAGAFVHGWQALPYDEFEGVFHPAFVEEPEVRQLIDPRENLNGLISHNPRNNNTQKFRRPLHQ